MARDERNEAISSNESSSVVQEMTDPAVVPKAEQGGFLARLGALRYPMYRRFWLGSIAAVGGFNLIVLAQGVLVFDLTGSPLDLGLTGAATAVPTILVTLFGGVLADRLDKRRLLMTTQAVLAVLLATLATLDATGVIKVWHVYVIAALTGLVTGLDWPVRQAIFTRLIELRVLGSAVALNSILWQGSRMVVPTLGGILIAWFGTAIVFYLGSIAFVIMLLVLISLRVSSTVSLRPRNPLRDLMEGIDYIRRTRLFFVLIPLTFANYFFGMTYIQLMPAYVDLFDGGPREIGYLFTIVGIGAVIGTVLTGRLQGGRRLGWMIMGAPLAFAGFVTLFAISPNYPVAAITLFAAGIFSSVFLISSMTVLQIKVPEELRGRVMGIHGITFSMIPLGGFFGGVLADIWGVRIAIAAGAAVLIVIIGAVAACQQQLMKLDGRRSA